MRIVHLTLGHPARTHRVRIAAALLLLICAHSSAAAQHGDAHRQAVVIDESGGAIGDARYVVRSTHGIVLRDGVVDEDGTFWIRGLPSGTYWLEVVAASFQVRRMSVEISVSRSEPLRVVLGVAPVYDEVTVTSQRGMIADIGDTPPIVTVRDRDDLRGRPMATIGQALEGATGVMVQQSTYGQVSPFLRGLTGYHVLNLVDGVRFNNSTFRSGPNQYLAFIDPAQVQRIEVMLGPASSQFGSDALGGAIQVLTPSVDFAAAPGVAVGGGGSVFAGSGDGSSGADAAVFVRGRRVSWMVGGMARRTGDVRAGGGRDSHHALRRFFGLTDEQIRSVVGTRQRDTGFTQSGLHTKVTARLGPQQSVTVWYQRSEQGNVRAYKDLWGGLGRLRSDFDPQRLQFAYARYERHGIGWLDWLSGTFSVNSQHDRSVRQGLLASGPIVQDDVRATVRGYAVQGATHAGDRHALVFGGEVYDEAIDAHRDETDPVAGTIVQRRALYPNGSGYRTSGLFIHDAFDLVRGDEGRALSAHVGGRFTHVRAKTDADRSRTGSGQSLGVVDSLQTYRDWTFNAGLTWSATRSVSVHLLAGRGFRAPNLNDLGALGLNDLGYEIPAEQTIGSGAVVGTSDGEAALSTERPVGNLRSERLFNYEVGTTLRWRRLYGRVQGFDAELRDPIVRRTLVFPATNPPSTLGGLPVVPIAATGEQQQQDIVTVAVAEDPRAVKAFVNDGRARYYGVDALMHYHISTRWSAEGTYSYLHGRDLGPSRPARRLPPAQGLIAVRYRHGGWVQWVEVGAHLSGAQDQLSGGDLTDERIGAARRRRDIADFFNGARVFPLVVPGSDGIPGTTDDRFAPTGETLQQIQDRVLPIGAVINGVTIVDDDTRAPAYTRTPSFVSINVRAALRVTDRLSATLALMNALDRNYRIHGSGIDAPGVNVFAGLTVQY